MCTGAVTSSKNFKMFSYFIAAERLCQVFLGHLECLTNVCSTTSHSLQKGATVKLYVLCMKSRFFLHLFHGPMTSGY